MGGPIITSELLPDIVRWYAMLDTRILRERSSVNNWKYGPVGWSAFQKLSIKEKATRSFASRAVHFTFISSSLFTKTSAKPLLRALHLPTHSQLLQNNPVPIRVTLMAPIGPIDPLVRLTHARDVLPRHAAVSVAASVVVISGAIIRPGTADAAHRTGLHLLLLHDVVLEPELWLEVCDTSAGAPASPCVFKVLAAKLLCHCGGLCVVWECEASGDVIGIGRR